MRYRHPGWLLLPVLVLFGCDKIDEAATQATAPPAALSASDSPLPTIEIEHYQLANGLNVILHVDDKMPAVNVNLWYHVGSKDEDPGKTGFAHLFEHMMFQGSRHVKGEYLALVEKAGASMQSGGVNGTTSADRTNYFQTVPSGSLEYVLWLESDRMGYLLDSVTQESLENQRDVVKNEKRQSDNRPYSSQWEIIARNMYPRGHPYGHRIIGSMEDLDNATLDDVKQFFERYYTPNNASLVLSGDFDPVQARQLIQKYFGPLPSGPHIPRQQYNVPQLERDILVTVEERVPQPQLTLVWHTPPWFDDEEAPLDFAAEILGQGKNSRLFRRLVLEEKIATRVTVYHGAQEAAGQFLIQVMGIPGASLDRIRDFVDQELQALAAEGPTEEEMRQRRSSHEYRFVSALERIGGFGGKADLLNSYWTFLREPDSFQRDYDRYQGVTPDQVVESLRKWVIDANRLELRFLTDDSGRPDQPEFDRSTPPAIGEHADFKAPVLEIATLDNGLSLVVHRRAGLPKVEAAVVIKAGELGETVENAGLSHLTTKAIEDGTESRGALEIQSELQSLGSQFTSRGDKFGSVATVSTLRKNLEPSLDILADMVLNPTFPDDEVALRKDLRINGLRQEQNNPARLASKLFPRLLFTQDHPGGVPRSGTVDSIARLTPADLRALHARFWRPNNASLVMAGDITVEEATALANRFFGAWEPAELPATAMADPQPPERTRVYLVDSQGKSQSQIRIGSLAPPRPAEGHAALLLMSDLLGGPFSSRLNLNLREDKGYAYGAHAYLVQRREFGYWLALASVESHATAPSLVEFRREIEGMSGAIPIGAGELGALQTSLVRSKAQKFETLAQVIRQVTPLVSFGLPLDEPERLVRDIQEQTAADINDMARRYLDMDRAIALVVGDLSVIEPAVVGLGWGDVYVVDNEGTILRRAGE
jgi:zinc protease